MKRHRCVDCSKKMATRKVLAWAASSYKFVMVLGLPQVLRHSRVLLMSNRIQLWSSGGGTQSAAIAVLILQGKLPRPDLAVIADTEREKASTWAYMDEYTQPALLEDWRNGPSD